MIYFDFWVRDWQWGYYKNPSVKITYVHVGPLIIFWKNS